MWQVGQVPPFNLLTYLVEKGCLRCTARACLCSSGLLSSSATLTWHATASRMLTVIDTISPDEQPQSQLSIGLSILIDVLIEEFHSGSTRRRSSCARSATTARCASPSPPPPLASAHPRLCAPSGSRATGSGRQGGSVASRRPHARYDRAQLRGGARRDGGRRLPGARARCRCVPCLCWHAPPRGERPRSNGFLAFCQSVRRARLVRMSHTATLKALSFRRLDVRRSAWLAASRLRVMYRPAPVLKTVYPIYTHTHGSRHSH